MDTKSTWPFFGHGLSIADQHRKRIAQCDRLDVCRACGVALKDHTETDSPNAYRRHWFVPPFGRVAVAQGGP